VHIEWSDIVTVFLLIGLEGILSGDNALVLAVLVLRLPEDQQRRALRYGILGAYVLRTIATLLAVYLTKLWWVPLVGGLYLLYLPYKHFTQHSDEEMSEAEIARTAAASGFLGLSLFWTTVVKVELTDLIFAIDSILVAVAMTKKEWVIITGGILGITMMRLLTLQVLALVKRYPKLIDGAYIVVAWVGFKLVWEFIHTIEIHAFKINIRSLELSLPAGHLIPALPKWLAIGMVIVLFVGSFFYAKAYENQEEPLTASTADAVALFGSDASPATGDDAEDGRTEVAEPKPARNPLNG
jgi:YkoY family integral membrane protein